MMLINKDSSQSNSDVIVTNLTDNRRIALHSEILNDMHDTYIKKNADYGNSFHDTFVSEGIASARIRLSDKLNRFKNLTCTERQVKDESIEDTLLDLANYAIMTVMELRLNKHQDKS